MRAFAFALMAVIWFSAQLASALSPQTTASTSASSASPPTSPTSSFTTRLIALTNTPSPSPTSEEEPRITDAPEFLGGGELQEKYHLTTFYTCVTIGSNVNCGIHEPVLPGGNQIGGAAPRGEVVWKVFGLGAAVLGVLMR